MDRLLLVPLGQILSQSADSSDLPFRFRVAPRGFGLFQWISRKFADAVLSPPERELYPKTLSTCTVLVTPFRLRRDLNTYCAKIGPFSKAGHGSELNVRVIRTTCQDVRIDCESADG